MTESLLCSDLLQQTFIEILVFYFALSHQKLYSFKRYKFVKHKTDI